MTYKEKVIDLLKRMIADTKKERDYLERYECSEDVKRLDGGLKFANNFLTALTSIKEDSVPEKIEKELEDAGLLYGQSVQSEYPLMVDAEGCEHPMFDTTDIEDAFKAGVEWHDRSLNWIRDLVKAGIEKPEEAVNILKRIDGLLND